VGAHGAQVGAVMGGRPHVEAHIIRTNMVKSAAQKWADDLIDLGRSNSLLYFKDTKTSTLDLTQSHPEALAALLTGQKTRLNALISDPAAHKLACTRARNLRKKNHCLRRRARDRGRAPRTRIGARYAAYWADNVVGIPA
jgi:hypothetical protein